MRAAVGLAATDHLVGPSGESRIAHRDLERLDRLRVQAHLAVRHPEIVVPLRVAIQLRLDAALELLEQAGEIERHRLATAERDGDAARLRRQRAPGGPRRQAPARSVCETREPASRRVVAGVDRGGMLEPGARLGLLAVVQGAIPELAGHERAFGPIVAPLAVGEPQLHHLRPRVRRAPEAPENRGGAVQLAELLVRERRLDERLRGLLAIAGAELLLGALEQVLDERDALEQSLRPAGEERGCRLAGRGWGGAAHGAHRALVRGVLARSDLVHTRLRCRLLLLGRGVPPGGRARRRAARRGTAAGGRDESRRALEQARLGRRLVRAARARARPGVERGRRVGLHGPGRAPEREIAGEAAGRARGAVGLVRGRRRLARGRRGRRGGGRGRGCRGQREPGPAGGGIGRGRDHARGPGGIELVRALVAATRVGLLAARPPVAGGLAERRRGLHVLALEQQHLRHLLEQLHVLLAVVERLPQRRGRLHRAVRPHHVLGVLREVDRGLAREPVERVQLRQVAQHLRLRERQSHHLLAHRDRVLVQAGLLVRGDAVQVALRGPALLPFLVEQVGEQHEVVRVGFRGLDELLVLPERSIQVTVLDAALSPTLDLDRLFQVGWISRPAPALGEEPFPGIKRS